MHIYIYARTLCSFNLDFFFFLSCCTYHYCYTSTNEWKALLPLLEGVCHAKKQMMAHFRRQGNDVCMCTFVYDALAYTSPRKIGCRTVFVHRDHELRFFSRAILESGGMYMEKRDKNEHFDTNRVGQAEDCHVMKRRDVFFGSIMPYKLHGYSPAVHTLTFW